MPASEVMKKWKSGELHSGSKKGPVVKDQKQAVAIMMSEKRAEAEHGGKYPEKKGYRKGGSVEPSAKSAAVQNLAETMANPTGPVGFAKGGNVGWKRWGQKGYSNG